MYEYEVSFKVNSEKKWGTEENVKTLANWISDSISSITYEVWVPADATIKDVTPREIKAGDTVICPSTDQTFKVEHRMGEWLWLMGPNSNSGELRHAEHYTLVREDI